MRCSEKREWEKKKKADYEVSFALQLLGAPKDFGAGTSYSRYTAAYLENREAAGDGTLIKTQPMKPAIIETGTQDVLAVKVCPQQQPHAYTHHYYYHYYPLPPTPPPPPVLLSPYKI